MIIEAEGLTDTLLASPLYCHFRISLHFVSYAINPIVEGSRQRAETVRRFSQIAKKGLRPQQQNYAALSVLKIFPGK